MPITGYSDGSARFKFIGKNTALSRTIAQKMDDAHKKEINFVPLVADLNLEILEDEDIKELFSCLLDNSFSACMSFTPKLRVVEMRICQKNSFIAIHILNPSVPTETIKDSIKASLKEKPTEGGLLTAISIVEKYNGSFKAEYKNDEFIIKILIPMI